MISQNLEIAQVGNPILRQQAQYVTDITDEKLQQLIDTLLTTAIDAKGVGIAAPQVSQSYRLFIVCSHPNSRYPDAPSMEPTVMINPCLVSHSEEMVKGWEGCLSVPGVRGLVSRYQKITVEYLDRYGKLHQQEFTDFVARIFQHELDHLNGILFIDRVNNSEDLVYNNS
ncbi:peptide deformylase [Crocosphaera chwakensis]|uniref:Peptide deformylase n=1 Tax=Crocosphaera chwakensis CCY0110 TaxID=391612 RepID=A3IW09_9CHRO|nr:peptide deformylase [Crocosphaera chwakensis]EAZ89320.1 polypeptide deformylase [Crocosphaera chwakensis CCY0110]